MKGEAPEDHAEIGYEQWCEKLASEFPRVPEYTRQSYARVLALGLPPGGFLRACINNDLRNAVANADENNIRALAAITRMVVCYGSGKKIS